MPSYLLAISDGDTSVLSYLISPRACHRFVGHLEEEAVATYTKCIKEIEAGRVPEWYIQSLFDSVLWILDSKVHRSDLPAPQIAIDYWRLDPNSKLLDVIYAVRSDETSHRFVNHSLANLDVNTDVNPFALQEPDMHTKGKKIASVLLFAMLQSFSFLTIRIVSSGLNLSNISRKLGICFEKYLRILKLVQHTKYFSFLHTSNNCTGPSHYNQPPLIDQVCPYF